ncbi:uncharacterized protein LOC134178924 [Corticium candelabrum]|uniref:uncharacterized protein LOC134178924 n=1 Tax=Corticium candelabrum TaxID=121492 RepID=UPI002E27528B|nr:uncharacterized protein LOC134178924 [Corticium candelabrum]
MVVSIIALLLLLVSTGMFISVKYKQKTDIATKDDLLMKSVQLEGYLKKTERVWKLLPRYLHTNPYGPFYLLDGFQSDELISSDLSNLRIAGRLLKEGCERQVCVNNVKNLAVKLLGEEMVILLIAVSGVYQLCQPQENYRDRYYKSVQVIKNMVILKSDESEDSPGSLADVGDGYDAHDLDGCTNAMDSVKEGQ